MTLMTLQELAGYLKVTEKTIHRLLQRGGIPATRVGRQWRFDRALIDRWLQENAIELKADILVVDDEQIVQTLFRETLEEAGHRVTTAGTAQEGLELAKSEEFDLVFLDLKMPGMDGATLFREIQAVKPNLPVIIITGYPDSEMMARALSYGPFSIMGKPFKSSDILTAVHNYLRFSMPTK